jgi:hypothetical protein
MRSFFLVLAAVVWLAHLAAHARVVDDASLGIRRFEFRGKWQKTSAMVVVHLRTVCIGQVLTVRGVMGVITLTPAVDKQLQYTVPKHLVDHPWEVQLHDPSNKSVTIMQLYRVVDSNDHTLSFSTVTAQLKMPATLELRVKGSPWLHELLLPDCVSSADAPHHPLQQLPGSLLNDKHWVAISMPSELGMHTSQYSTLLMSNLEYHRQMGFAGVIVLCDQHQSTELLQQPAVQAASLDDQLLIWPWVGSQQQLISIK